jgi:hypothetical protein
MKLALFITTTYEDIGSMHVKTWHADEHELSMKLLTVYRGVYR